MNVGFFIGTATKQLTKAGINSARLDVLILLEDELKIERAHILAHPELPLSLARLNKLNTKIMQRCHHMPLAYIRGKAAFFGRDFIVNNVTLVPRPESEALIEILLSIKDLPATPRIADIGTGSGCLGITAALELGNAQVDLYDIDVKALAVARHNADVMHATVHTYTSDLLSSTIDVYDTVLANLPYVPSAYPINTAAQYEPALALFAGDDGLELYRKFWHQLAAMPTPVAHVITESLVMQHDALALLAKDAGYRLSTVRGLAQHFICVPAASAALTLPSQSVPPRA